LPTTAAEFVPLNVKRLALAWPPFKFAVKVTPFAREYPPPPDAEAVAPSFQTREDADRFVMVVQVALTSTVIVKLFE
jgi:hypothetical protein